MKIGIVFVICLALLATVAGVAKEHLSQGFCDVPKYGASQCSCSNEINGLQYCASVAVVTSKNRLDGRVILNDSLKNVSETSMRVPRVANIAESYRILIIDPSGSNLTSVQEDLEKKAREKGEFINRPMSTKDPLLPGPTLVELSSNTEIKSEFDLSALYKFAARGNYQIEIVRKLPKPEGSGTIELSAGTFVIELK